MDLDRDFSDYIVTTIISDIFEHTGTDDIDTIKDKVILGLIRNDLLIISEDKEEETKAA